MKRGRHPQAALTALRVKNEKRPGRFADGNGLYLEVDSSGARRWLLRLVIKGKRRDLGLGSAVLVTLSEARQTALAWRKAARQGLDPVHEFKNRNVAVPTFKEAAVTVHGSLVPTFRNAKHAAQWLSTLETYVFPSIGDSGVNEVETPDVLKLMTPIWTTKPETASRVLQRIRVVFDWAKSAGHRTGENPVNDVKAGLAKRPRSKKHFRAMPFAEVPSFVRNLRADASNLLTHLPLEFLILTAARTTEVLHARWSEIDIEKRTWTIPPSRMKAHREHRIPLAERSIEILRTARELSPMSAYVFQGQKADKALSNMSLIAVMRRLKSAYVPHGFRSSFRDWAGETTQHPHDVCEMALAHTIKNKAEAAYRRGDMLERRRVLMDDWAAYLKSQHSSAD